MNKLDSRMDSWGHKIGQCIELTTFIGGSDEKLSFVPTGTSIKGWEFTLKRGKEYIGKGLIFVSTDGSYAVEVGPMIKGNEEISPPHLELLRKEIIALAGRKQYFVEEVHGVKIVGTLKDMQAFGLFQTLQKIDRADFETGFWINVDVGQDAHVFQVVTPKDFFPAIEALKKVFNNPVFSFEATESFFDQVAKVINA